MKGTEKASGGRNKGRTLKLDAEALLATRIGEYKYNRTIAFQGSVHHSE